MKKQLLLGALVAFYGFNAHAVCPSAADLVTMITEAENYLDFAEKVNEANNGYKLESLKTSGQFHERDWPRLKKAFMEAKPENKADILKSFSLPEGDKRCGYISFKTKAGHVDIYLIKN